MSIICEEKVYNNFSMPYAFCGEGNFSVKMANWIIERIIQCKDVNNSIDIVDLACGIGEAAIIFAKQGHNVIGLDISASMLQHAKKKARTEKINVKWINDDMRNLDLTEEVDLVTCMYDAINFMATQNDIYLVFESVFKALRKNGQFIFDMYTLSGLAEQWGSKVEIHTNTNEFFVVSQTEWNVENSINTKILHGVNYDGGHWNRWCEKHVAKAYPIKTIKEYLYAVGFTEIGITGWENNESVELDSKGHRILVIAKK